MSSFMIKSYDEETKEAVVCLNGSSEEQSIIFDDEEATNPTKMMAIFKAYAGDGNVVQLTQTIPELTFNESIDCDTLV